MKHIGIVGITAEGTALCYKTIVAQSARLVGQNIHPEISINNISFDQILALQKAKSWSGVAKLMCSSIQKLSSIGTEVAIIPANSIHYAIEEILRISPIPVLNLVDLVANECITRGFKKIAILGVGITMSDGLYERSLMNVGVETITPSVEVQSELNDIIYNEIVPGIYTEETTQKIVNILDGLRSSGCDSVILGCTELPILITEANSSLPFIDTTRLLAIKSLDYALS